VDSKGGAHDVLLYQSPAKTGSQPIDVLYGDGHIGVVKPEDQQAFLKVAGTTVRPVRWP
jgi:hypothetical protein